MITPVVRVRTPDTSGISCFCVEGKEAISQCYGRYTTDESNLPGSVPDRLFFPTSTLETSAVLADLFNRHQKVTVSGARTGIAGGAVCLDCENIVSLEKLVIQPELKYSQKEKAWYITAAAGTTLAELNEAISDSSTGPSPGGRPNLIYPVDPTETSASLGGTLATNASGARTLYYGPTRKWVRALTVVLADGSLLDMERGQYETQNGTFIFITDDGRQRTLHFDDIRFPKVKHVAGYNLCSRMDLIDLFIGSEGTLGIITEFQLYLAPAFAESLYLYLFCDQVIDIGEFVCAMKKSFPADLIALEFMDTNSVRLLKEHRLEYGESTGIPELPEDLNCIFYIETGFDGDETLEQIENFLQVFLAGYGMNITNTWAEFGPRTPESMKNFRHALPEKVNSIISERKKDLPGLTKLGTDMSVPDTEIPRIMKLYRRVLDQSGIEYVIFGHIGNGHVHINFLPKNMEEVSRAKKIYLALARKIVSRHGSISAEHGIGKLKTGFLDIQYNKLQKNNIIKVKLFFDNQCFLNPGVLLKNFLLD